MEREEVGTLETDRSRWGKLIGRTKRLIYRRKRWTWKTEQTDVCLHTLLICSPALESEKPVMNPLNFGEVTLLPGASTVFICKDGTKHLICIVLLLVTKYLRKAIYGEKIYLAQGFRSFDP